MRLLLWCWALAAFSSGVNAQDMKMGTVLYVDACERHRVQMAEMTRGAGASSNNIPEFAFFIEVTAYIDAYNTYTGAFENRDQALESILKSCEDDPTTTIGRILFDRYQRIEALRERQHLAKEEAEYLERKDLLEEIQHRLEARDLELAALRAKRKQLENRIIELDADLARERARVRKLEAEDAGQ